MLYLVCQLMHDAMSVVRNARVIDLMTLNSDSDFKAKSDDSDSSHDSMSLDSG